MPADSRGLRLSIVGIVVMSLLVALLGRLWYLQVMDPASLEQVTTSNQVRTVQLPPMRGRVVDSQGRVLADNKPTTTVTVERKVIRKKSTRTALFQRLAGPLGTTPDALEARYNSDQFDPLLSFPAAENVDESIAIFLKERREDYPGVEVEEGWQRVYRYAPVASQIVGYLGRINKDNKDAYLKKGYQLSDTVGIAGVEQAFEGDLRGKPGFIKYAVNAQNQIVGVIERQDPVAGNDVQLSVDLKVQQYAEEALAAGIAEARTHCVLITTSDGKKQCTGRYFPAPAGALVVQDPRNGEVLAMASNPTFDNRWFVGGLPSDKFKQLFPDGERSPLVDRAVSGRYQIGSTMKLITSVAALESGQLENPNVVYDDKGSYEIPNCNGEPSGCIKHNSGALRPGRINLVDALAMSSDDYFYKLGAEMWIEQSEPVLQNTAKQFGFGSATGIDLPNEYQGLIPTAEVKKRLADQNIISKAEGEGYFTGDNVQLAIGQGLIAVTPLQLTNAYSTFANGGTRFRPLIATRVYAPGSPDAAQGVVDVAQTPVVREIAPQAVASIPLQPAWIQAMTAGFDGVVQRDKFPFGTAYDTFNSGAHPYDFSAMPIVGKTGTAQGADPSNAQLDSSLFVGFGPAGTAEQPRYAVGAIIEKGGFGADGAAAVVKCVFEALSGQTPMDEPVHSEPLDRNSNQAAVLPTLADKSCLQIPTSGRD